MKRIVIGDPHGRWGFIKQIYDKEQPEEVIILGDYFDSFDIDVYTQRESYEHIIELRKEHLKKYHRGFVMLIGNHDMHYMDEKFGRCSGWNALSASVAGYPLCRDWDKEILQMCYIDEVNKTIYSHAGVSLNWFRKWCTFLGEINVLDTPAFIFTYRDGGDAYGSSTYSSPLWLRPEGLQKSMYVDESGTVWNQIFGHTQVDAPFHWQSNGADFYGIDCIWKHYLVEELDDNCKVIKRYLGDVMS